MNDYTNVILETVNTPVIKTEALQVKNKEKLNWKTILLNIALFSGIVILLFYWKNSRKKRKSTIQKVANSTPIETVAEAEEKLKAQHHFSFKEELIYLEKIKNNKNPKMFFSVYDNMIKDFENQIVAKSDLSFNSYFEKNYGRQFAEDFKTLSNKISIEKYSPLASEESLEELFSEIKQLFSKIEE